VNVLLFALGSHGDVHPFCGIGIRLRQRGHHVAVAANGYFRALVEHAQLEFIECGTAQQYKELATNPDLWHPVKALGTVFRGTARYLRPMYEIAAAFGKRPDSVIAASTLALGARVAQDKYNLRLATVHLSPSIFLSAHVPPQLPVLRWLPRSSPLWLKRGVIGLIHKGADRLIAPQLNQFRAEVGLAPVRGILSEYWHSPLRVIGLFPEWFAPPQPDWPTQTRLSGFPLWDEPDLSPISEELDQFLCAGEKPIAFTPGSAMWRGDRFFDAAIDACVRLNRRGILLTRHTEHLPERLSDGVIHVPYAPFSQLLPRCCALVHHGGIGTTAQALASGTPQLITPFAHDQPDNAARVHRLGCGEILPPRRFRGKHPAVALARVITSPGVADACRRVVEKFQGPDPIDRTCDLIEQLHG
jgi:UDP:flavonoid glycosyltransferase YjiC (YdhE family)